MSLIKKDLMVSLFDPGDGDKVYSEKSNAPVSKNTGSTSNNIKPVYATPNKTEKNNATITPSTTGNKETAVAPVDTAVKAGSPAQDSAIKMPEVKVPEYTTSTYQPSDVVKQAEAMIQQQMANKPGAYQSPWETQLNEIIDKINNREEFSYDMNGDAFYQLYKDKFVNQGKMAMMDTMGQAAAMTGGYGNSYAQSVGQQAYQGQLQQLNDKIPELYNLALSKYQMEGDALYDRAALMAQQEIQDYGRYRDQISDHYAELDRLVNRYNTERDYDYGKWADNRNFDYGKQVDDRNFAYEKQENEHSKLVNLITSTGYKPSAEELAAAGMTADQAKSYANYYKEQKNAAVKTVDPEDKTMSLEDYNAVRSTAEDYFAKYGEDGLNNYLNDMVNYYGMPAESAMAIFGEICGDKKPVPPPLLRGQTGQFIMKE